MILLDMEIPKNCWSCSMQKYAVHSDDHICAITGKFAEEIEGRSAFCPIKAEIPKNATNGDVIKTMFPEGIPKDIVWTLQGDKGVVWWNAPWKGQKNDTDKRQRFANYGGRENYKCH